MHRRSNYYVLWASQLQKLKTWKLYTAYAMTVTSYDFFFLKTKGKPVKHGADINFHESFLSINVHQWTLCSLMDINGTVTAGKNHAIQSSSRCISTLTHLNRIGQFTHPYAIQLCRGLLMTLSFYSGVFEVCFTCQFALCHIYHLVHLCLPFLSAQFASN